MKSINLKRIASLAVCLSALATTVAVQAQDITRYSGPIIDMHLHGYDEDSYWGGREHPTGVSSPATAEKHLQQTQAFMDQYNIKKAVIDGITIEMLTTYLSEDSRFLPGYNDQTGLPDIKEFERLVKKGTIKIFGEVLAVYQGKTLSDPVYEPYLKICEKYGIPVAYHTGGGPPMTPYTCCPDFRISLGDPLLIEDVLVKHPKLKIYLMHSGGLFLEHTIRMMKMYPQLHAGVGVLLWVDPMTKNYALRFLKLAKEVGVLDRVMYGTDQMVWPGAIGKSVDFLNAIDFLTKEDKANVFYNNAERFLELTEEEIAGHQNNKNDISKTGN